ncbi:MAG TPA: multiprotein-bridging factor 1 family protein [Candidatus Norongarragalinales archaeon]|nr:multiprotein-bridging factor 1 family protein [Candidatus Norongarragalinales archaeon]
MSSCDVCGRREAIALAVIEGARMNVCIECARLGKELRPAHKTDRPIQTRPAVEVSLVQNFGSAIRNARQRANLSVEQLAQKLFLREHDLGRFESGSLKPTESDARKIERFLKIRLIATGDEAQEPEEKQQQNQRPGGQRGFTLADVVEIKRS